MELTIAEFNEFVNELYPELLRAALRLCHKDYAMAEDALQNTLLLAFEKLDQFKVVNSETPKVKLFRGWLHKMLTNMVYYMWTRKGGAPKPHQQKFAYASFVYCIKTGISNFSEYESADHKRQDYVENHSNPVYDSSDVEYIIKAIDELPSTLLFKDIAKFAFIDGLTSPEIAVRLQLAEATIRCRISMIRTILCEKLAPQLCEHN